MVRTDLLIAIPLVGLVLSGCAGAAPTMSPLPERTVTITAAPTPAEAPTVPTYGQITWEDGSVSEVPEDSARLVGNIFGMVDAKMALKQSYAALVKSAKVGKKGDLDTVTLVIDKVTPVNTSNESDSGYRNPDTASQVVTMDMPLVLINPPQVQAVGYADFVKHLNEINDLPYSFYSQDGELVAMVQWYHP
jgi:hypothetical protein